MVSKSVLSVIVGAVFVPALFALPAQQREPIPSVGNQNDSGMSSTDRGSSGGAPTPAQQFIERLKLDAKTQVPAVAQIFDDAAKEAAPVGQQMLQLRQQLVNVALANKLDDMKPIVDAYAAAAAKMTGIEARAFAQVYATLKPNQQANAAQAFTIMGGMFQPPAPRGQGSGGGQSAGQGGRSGGRGGR